MAQGLNNFGTYSTVIDGVLLPDGYADGDAVTVAPNAAIYSDVVGSDGELHQSTTEDRTGLVTIRVKNTSLAARTILDGIIRRHELGLSTPSVIVCSMLSTGEVYTCTGCRPQDRPTATFSSEVSDREYTFRAARITKS